MESIPQAGREGRGGKVNSLPPPERLQKCEKRKKEKTKKKNEKRKEKTKSEKKRKVI